MKILFITSSLPFPIHKDGVSLIDNRLLSNATADMEVDMISIGEEKHQDIDSLKATAPRLQRIFCVKNTETWFSKLLNFISVFIYGKALVKNRHLHKTLRQLLQTSSYDMIYASRFPLIYELAGIKKMPPLFLNAIDSYSMLCSSIYEKNGRFREKAKYIFYRRSEKKLLKYATCVNFVSFEDAKYIKSITKHKNIQNITLGIDSKLFFRRLDIEKINNSLLFSGNFAYQPNFDTAKYVAQELFPVICQKHPEAKLYIVGKNPPPIQPDKRIVVTGFVEDISEWYNKTTVFLSPLLHGAGVKNKILEALACGLPVVASSIAVSGISGLVNEEHFLLADTSTEQVQAVERLLSCSSLREKLSENAQSFIQTNYNWDKQVQLYYSEFNTVVKK